MRSWVRKKCGVQGAVCEGSGVCGVRGTGGVGCRVPHTRRC